MKDLLRLFTANMHKGPLTTALGMVIIVASVVSVFLLKHTWSEAAAGIAGGTALLGLKDPTLPGGTGAVVCLLLVLGVGGCASQKQQLYGTQNPPASITLQSTLKMPVWVKTKADSLSTSFSLDSLADAPAGQVVRHQSRGGQATVRVWKSPVTKVGGSQRLNVRVDVPPRVVHDTITQVVTMQGQCPPTYTISQGLTRWQRIWRHYQDFCTSLVSILLVVALILLCFRLGFFRFLKLVPFLSLALVLASGCRAQPAPAPPYHFAPRQPSYLKQPLPRPLYRPHSKR